MLVSLNYTNHSVIDTDNEAIVVECDSVMVAGSISEIIISILFEFHYL